MKDLTIDELNVLLCSTGYLPPRNEEELLFFDEIYEDYESCIEDRHMDRDMILNGSCRIVKEYHFIDNSSLLSSAKVAEDIHHPYSMAARNYDKFPKEVLDKMRQQHILND